MNHDQSDLGLLILIRIIPKERTQGNFDGDGNKNVTEQ